MTDQRWLSLDAICTVLRLTKPTVRALANKGFLVRIGKPGSYRYLDPTAEYAEQLRLAALLHQKAFPVSANLSEKCLLTAGEIGQILGGKTPYQTNHWLDKHRLPSYKIGKALHVYVVNDVREALLRRKGRVNSHQRAPFLIPEIIEYLRSAHAEDLRLVPTDSALYQDDLLARKLERLADLGESAQKDFADKVELARRIVQILESAKSNQL